MVQHDLVIPDTSEGEEELCILRANPTGVQGHFRWGLGWSAWSGEQQPMVQELERDDLEGPFQLKLFHDF